MLDTIVLQIELECWNLSFEEMHQSSQENSISRPHLYELNTNRHLKVHLMNPSPSGSIHKIFGLLLLSCYALAVQYKIM